MKNLKHILAAIILMACTTITKAVDRIVEENGFGGAFTTIQAAINASVSNDRIIIYPRAGGASYVENPTAGAQTGIQMLSAIEGTRYKITGGVLINTGWQVIGAEVTGAIFTNGNGSAIERVINCVVIGTPTFPHAVFSNTSAAILHIDNCTITTHTSGNARGVYMGRGRVTGSTINVTSSASTGIFVFSFASSDTTVITGNRIEFLGAVTSCMGISVNGTNNPSNHQYLHITNNFIKAFGASINAVIGMYIQTGRQPSGSARNIVHNNTILFNSITSAAYGIGFGVSGNGATTIDVRNNIIQFYATMAGPYGAYYRETSSLLSLNFQYNHVTAGSNTAFTLNGITPDATNISTSNTINPTTGALIGTTPGVNGGDPTPAYLDLDLTTNDVGCFGGSMSMANFNVTDNGSRVLYMNLPRTMYINQSLNIKADGVDK